jgi:hypothetical protein
VLSLRTAMKSPCYNHNAPYTPKHGSWLNMAEIELSLLQRQCLNRHIADEETRKREVTAWEQHSNEA